MKKLTLDECKELMTKYHGNEITLLGITTKQRIKQGKTINETFCICKCNKCGYVWEAATYNIFKSKPTHCSNCSHPSKKKTTEQFINESRKIHGNKYDYSKVIYINKSTLVCIICPIHGEFWQKPTDHLRGCGCQKCNYSKLELQVDKLLNENNIEYIPQYKTKWLGKQSYDFYLPKQNIAIECQGEQHYKNVDFGDGKPRLEYYKKLDKIKLEKSSEQNVQILYFAKEKYNENIITCESELLKNIQKL